MIKLADNAVKLKWSEKPESNGWFWQQKGGKDPQIRIIYVEGGWWQFAIIVRADTVYFSHMKTTTLPRLQFAMALCKDAQGVLDD